MSRHQLLGAEVSYYTGKVRAYLRYKGIAFDEIQATPDVYRQVIIPRTGVRFIPVLISEDGAAVQDSTAIIDFLEQRHPCFSVYPAGPQQRLAALLFELYGDEWLLLPAMHYRWNVPENRAFAIEEFGRLAAPDAPAAEQRAIGEKRAGPFAGALPVLGVQAETVSGIEASYLAFLRDFSRHLAEQPFLLGTRPSIGDFGLYGPLYAHLYRDPASGRLMRDQAPAVADWVERMGSPVSLSGDFAPDDGVATTLEPLLSRLFRELGPVLARTLDAIDRHPIDPARPELPRALGKHAFELEGASGERAIFPFNVWRWQRAHDQYQQLTGRARDSVDAWLTRLGGLELMRSSPARRLARIDNKLLIAPS